jgi:hypothetical protein
VHHAREATLEDVFDGEPALLVVLRPSRMTQDPLYGPFLRRAGELASAKAAVAEAVGSTALAVLQRTEEVVLGVYDEGAHDVVIALRGPPADVDPSRIVDTVGKPIWLHARDLPNGVEELAPAEGSDQAALFVLPRRAWVIAVGKAVVRSRTVFVEGPRKEAARFAAVDDDPLAVFRLEGDALLRARPALAEGALAPMVRDLQYASISLQPGPEGDVGEVTGRFVYGEPAFAEKAEACAIDVLLAFTRMFDKKAPWLHAVKVSRAERAVLVKGRIPRAWADGFLHVDLDDFAK